MRSPSSVAFAAAQLRLLTVESRLYLVLNLAGSLVLGLDAWHERQWGFLLLEGVWALVSAWEPYPAARYRAGVRVRCVASAG